MYIKIRKLGEKSDEIPLLVSRKMLIVEIRKKIQEKLDIEPERQKLYYGGKELSDCYTLLDYKINLNDVIQLFVKTLPTEEKIIEEEQKKEEIVETVTEEIDTESEFYQIGDYVDMKDADGAWFEAKIARITKRKEIDKEELIFHVVRRSDVERGHIQVTFNDIRPQSYFEIKRDELKPNHTVLVNYNVDEPKKLGFWYDFCVDSVKRNGLKGSLLFNDDENRLEIEFKPTQPVYRIEALNENINRDENFFDKLSLRKIPYICSKCKDDPKKKCNDCGCKICFGKRDWDKILLCDECNYGYHIYCLDPPLEKVPDENDWFCPNCKIDENEIVMAGGKLKATKKKSASNQNSSTKRDWGKGMACVGRTKICTIVPVNHLGPIPGVQVGTCWRYRTQVSGEGVHRAPVSGIHGSESHFAYSIVVSGGYEDDVDNGEEILYTGSGGRDLSGNKRVNKQTCDQKLTRENKALSNNCNLKNWKNGEPVRVVRSFKLKLKKSKYAPELGYRYDGIYKVVKFYQEKGKSGFIVWRYLLRRDDPNPAPWHKNGQELPMILPDGYEEAESSKKDLEKRGKKRKPLQEKDHSLEIAFKKAKKIEFKLDSKLTNLIDTDEANEKLWLEAKESLKDGQSRFLEVLQELFMCICCQELVLKPVTTSCKHNFCLKCLKRAFNLKMFTCPCCRNDLGKKYPLNVNENLSEVLLSLFPGYQATR
nr:E3 ubiquitin-protein ligase UHRF1-like [Onthophagus taurus]